MTEKKSGQLLQFYGKFKMFVYFINKTKKEKFFVLEISQDKPLETIKLNIN